MSRYNISLFLFDFIRSYIQVNYESNVKSQFFYFMIGNERIQRNIDINDKTIDLIDMLIN